MGDIKICNHTHTKESMCLECEVVMAKHCYNDKINQIEKLEQENLNHRNKFFETCMYISLKKIIDDQSEALFYYKSELIDKNNVHYGWKRRPDCGTAIKAMRNTKEALEKLGL